MMRRYRVTIYYREPAYELRAGKKEQPYSAFYDVTVPSEQTAIQNALSKFQLKASQSSAHWYRKIVDIAVREIEGA